MLSDFLKNNITSGAGFIAKNGGYGYGQVEPNHLSAQRTGQIYAQLPAAASIEKLENGQFVKYDYAQGVVDFTGPGEWMLVFNEIKLYREGQLDCEFAMLKDNYQARVYSPFGGPDKAGNPVVDTAWTKQSRWYNGVDSENNTSITIGGSAATYKVATTFDGTKTYYADADGTALDSQPADATAFAAGTFYEIDQEAVAGKTYTYDDVTSAPDMYEIHYNEDPFHIEGRYYEKMMPEGTTMVPRVFKTNVGVIYTTNTIADETLISAITPGTTKFYVGDNGYLTATKKNSANDNGAASGDMEWLVVKVYTMPDHQAGLKIMRIA